jgi:putative nucleotidyltransferase with HDIG domain
MATEAPRILKKGAMRADQQGVGRRAITTLASGALFFAALAIVVLTSRAADWQPLGLFAILALLSMVSHALAIRAKEISLSGSFMALVLAMAFLGPAPAVAIGVMTIAAAATTRLPPWPLLVNNLATYVTFPLVGALLVRFAVDHGYANGDTKFALVILGVYWLALILNFTLIAGARAYMEAVPLWPLYRTSLVPVLPSESVAAILVVVFAVLYRHGGVAAVTLLSTALFAFQYLTRALVQSQERAEQLSERTTQMASLQVGVLAALVQTLSLRDKMTARHSAAVARYAKAMAEATDCSEAEQELVHTAGLLHDIGKFIFPDSILFAASRLSDDEWDIVKRHPAQGARVVAKVEGYGPVADIIHCHHERIDGTGYPRGLSGDKIPKFSKMISIADTYDVMTARDSYRKPVTQAEAVAELRRVSGAQLDGELVEVFIAILERRGLNFQHTTDADFERELGFEARVAGFLQAPKAA